MAELFKRKKMLLAINEGRVNMCSHALLHIENFLYLVNLHEFLSFHEMMP